MGNEVQGAYQYANQKYSGRTVHPEPLNDCTSCHDGHTLELELEKCGTCHAGAKTTEDLLKWRKADDTVDYDGDGTAEGYGEEIQGMADALWVQIQAIATKNKYPIVYDANTNPYFFNDLNGDGQIDPDEAKSANRYGYFNAKLLQAAYNYQWVSKDPGAYAHNFSYINQLLYDSIKDLGGQCSEDEACSSNHCRASRGSTTSGCSVISPNSTKKLAVYDRQFFCCKGLPTI